MNSSSVRLFIHSGDNEMFNYCMLVVLVHQVSDRNDLPSS